MFLFKDFKEIAEQVSYGVIDEGAVQFIACQYIVRFVRVNRQMPYTKLYSQINTARCLYGSTLQSVKSNPGEVLKLMR